MKKALGSWSGMRRYLEREMLAPALRGRVRYHCTRYTGMERCHIFSVYIDGEKQKSFSWETVNSYFIDSGFTQNKAPFGQAEYWREFWSLLDTVPMRERTEYTDEEFCEALTLYRNQPIADSLRAENPLVRMFAILDRRLGRRTLAALKNTPVKPLWLSSFYQLRFHAEQL